LKSVEFGLLDITKPRPFTITVSLYPGQPDCSINAKYPVGCPLWVGTIDFPSGGSNPNGRYTITIPESARPYMIADPNQWYTLTFEGINTTPGDWTHGWWLSSSNCSSPTYPFPMPGGGTFGIFDQGGPVCYTDYHVAFNTVMATIPGLSVSDNCTVKTVGYDIPSGSFFDYGTTNVNYTVTDLSGNTSTCVMPVVVTDNVPPTITCATPAASYNADPGVCNYTVAGPPPVFVAPKIDNFWMAMGGLGALDPGLSGGIANDPGEDGIWYEYFMAPELWWNIWFYNEPLDPDRMKIIHMGFWVQELVPGPGGFLNYVINWSNDLYPNGTGTFPTPFEEIFIAR